MLAESLTQCQRLYISQTDCPNHSLISCIRVCVCVCQCVDVCVWVCQCVWVWTFEWFATVLISVKEGVQSYHEGWSSVARTTNDVTSFKSAITTWSIFWSTQLYRLVFRSRQLIQCESRASGSQLTLCCSNISLPCLVVVTQHTLVHSHMIVYYIDVEV